MAIAFHCPGCGQGYKVAEGLAGRPTQCKKCGIAMTIPAATTFTTTPNAPYVDEELLVVEEYTDKPRKSKKKKRSSTLLALLLAGGMCFACLIPAAVGVGVYFWYTSSRGLGDAARFLPNDSQMIFSFRMDEITASPIYRDAERQFADMFKQVNVQEGTAFAPADVRQIIVAGNIGAKEPIVVVHAKKTLAAQDILANLRTKQSKEEKVGGYTMHRFRKVSPFDDIAEAPPDDANLPQAFCLVDGKTVVMGDSEQVRSVLQRDKPADLSEGLKAALKHADLSRPIGFAFNVKDLTRQAEANPFGMPQNLTNVEGVAGSVSLKSDVSINVVVLCKDARSADDLRKMADGGIAAARNAPGMRGELLEVLDAIKLASSGNLMTASVYIKGDTLTRSMRPSAFPFPRFGGAGLD